MVKKRKIPRKPANKRSTMRRRDISGARSDLELIDLWISQKESPHTKRAYKYDADLLLYTIHKPLKKMTMIDLQKFSNSLSGSDCRKRSIINAIKSLFSYAHEVGYLDYNISVMLKTVKIKNRREERILSESEIKKIISLEKNHRNKLILKFLYVTGCRVAELCSLKWGDISIKSDVVRITIYGKGNKTRSVVLNNDVWLKIKKTMKTSTLSDPIFRSNKGGHFTASAIWYIVKKATKRANINKNVSPHWFRHAYASHSLDHGLPVHVVQSNLGHSNLDTTGLYTHSNRDIDPGKYLNKGILNA